MRRTAAEAAETRQAITRSALHLFASDGWEGCSLADVARGAGVTRGAVYHHFIGKRDLLEAVLIEQWDAQTRDLLAILDDGGTAADQRLAGFCAAYLRRLADDPAFRDLAVVSTMVAPQALPISSGLADKRQALAQWDQRLQRALQECGDALAAPVPAGMFVIMAFLHGATLTAATAPDDLPASQQSRPIAEAIVHGLVRDAPARVPKKAAPEKERP